MKKIYLGFLVFLSQLAATSTSITARGVDDDVMKSTRAIVDEIRAHSEAYENLRELTSIGHRLSGSENAAKAVEWAKAKMESYGFDRVWLQPMKAPKWERGAIESAKVQNSQGSFEVNIAALGGSVGTASEGLTAPVIEVSSLDEVKRLGAKVKGKIVFYNRPMDPALADTFDAYSGAVDQRSSGPSTAASYGAVATLVRTLTTLVDDDHPHTGLTRFRANAMIPAAAISTLGANLLSAALKKDPNTSLRMVLSAKTFDPVPSFNVIGEYNGKESPNEFVVVSGHLDSWDLGQGAHDDGAGVVQSIEVVRALKAAGIRPKKTIRVVLFMSEEFGGIGGAEYALQAVKHGEKHAAAIESDRGGFAPIGFAGHAPNSVVAKIRSWQNYLSLASAGEYAEGESGTDIEPLEALGVPCFGYVPVSTHYFDYHHSSTDRFEAVDKTELDGGASAMAILAFLLADNI